MKSLAELARERAERAQTLMKRLGERFCSMCGRGADDHEDLTASLEAALRIVTKQRDEAWRREQEANNDGA